MRTFLRRFRHSYLPFVTRIEETVRSFSASGRALFLFFSGVLVLSALGLVFLFNDHFLVTTPAYGGSLSEGIIGAPRFINPILAISDADRDLTSLTYAGLLSATPTGEYTPTLAEDYTISPDGRVYTFTLRKGITFHDGTPVTADDVLYTIQKTQDPALKSPQRANWDGVVVEKVDDRTITFTLKSAYAPFLENLTLGIIPKHLWQNISDDEMPFSNLNTSPVGAGPFEVESISRTSSGIPASYELSSFGNYALGRPFLNNITLRFYQSEDTLTNALKNGTVEAASSLSPTSLEELKGFPVLRSPLNRIFGVFFNQNQSEILRDKAVRQALSDAIDRRDLVEKVLGGYGTPLAGPVPPSVFPDNSSTTAGDIERAKQELASAGWKMGANHTLEKTTGSGKNAKTTQLTFSLATGNVPELRAAAEYLRTTWEQLGVQVHVEIYDQGDLAQNVIRPRKYDALLFGEVIGREIDLFAFWHSSQRNDPGLNVALYTNPTADKLLEQLRQTSDEGTRALLYTKFKAELDKDVPALFLYAPDFVYSVPKDVLGLQLGFIETPSDRFLTSASWHRETDRVWPFFAKQVR